MALLALVLFQTPGEKKSPSPSRVQMQKQPTLLELLLEHPVLDFII